MLQMQDVKQDPSATETEQAGIAICQAEKASHMYRHQCPGYSTTDDYRVTRNITLERRVVRREAIADQPKGMIRSEIHKD
jgi:hypothetical protein